MPAPSAQHSCVLSQNLQAQLSLTDQGVSLDIAQPILVNAQNQARELQWACR